MNILLFMAHAGYARNFEWTLRELADRGHTVEIALDRFEKRNVPDLNQLLETIAAEHPNVTLTAAPPRSRGDHVGVGLRSWLDYLRYLEPAYTHSDRTRDRAASRVPTLLRHAPRVWPFRGDRGRARLGRLLALAERSAGPSATVRRFITERSPDVVLVTPLVELGSPQVDYLRSARSAGIPTGLLVASWDNLTRKGGIHEIPDLVAVWNEAQRQEAFDLHGVSPERVAVTGAVAYDHWYRMTPSPRDDLCTRVGIEATRPYVLYVGSSGFIAPDESRFFFRLLASLRDVSEFHGVQVVARPHPTNPFNTPDRRAEAAAQENLVLLGDNVNPTTSEARQEYFDLVHHAGAVVGINTSAMVEAAIAGRPVHSVLAPEYADAQDGALHFAYLRPENGGHILLAGSEQELARQLVDSLRNPLAAAKLDAAFVRRFLAPPGDAPTASGELVRAIELLAGAHAAAPETLSLPRRVVGMILAGGARLALVGLWSVLKKTPPSKQRQHRLRKLVGAAP